MQLIQGDILHCQGPDARLEWFPDAAILLNDTGIIQAKGTVEVLRQQAPEALRIDLRGKILVPSFIDTHIHFPQMDMIGCMEPALLPWLKKYTFPTEIAYRGRSESLLRAAHDFVDELLNNGTSLACVYSSSNYEVTDLLFEVFAARGLRGIIGKTSMDRQAPDELIVGADDDLKQQALLLERWHGYEERLHLALTPRFAPSCSRKLMKGLAALHAQHPDTYVQTHYAENLDELKWIKQLYPKARDYLDVYESFDLIGPRSILAHGIHVAVPAMKRLARRRSIISHCPTSNMFLGSGIFAWKKMESHGVPIALGTDVGAGTSFSIWQTMNEAYKVSALRGEPVNSVDLLAAATLKAARALGLEQLGSLDVGFHADFQVINQAARPLLARRLARCRTGEEILAALIHLCDETSIESVWVKGKNLCAL